MRNESAIRQPGRDPLKRKYKVLFIGPGPVPPSKDPRKNLHFHISEFCEGDFISKHWGSPKDYRGQSLTDIYDMLGSFRYHATLSEGIPRPLRPVWEFAYLLRKGLQLSRARGRFDAIVAYGPFSFAFVGWLLRRWTGAKLVIEVPGPPLGGHAFEPGLINRIKSRVARLYVPRLLRSADALRLLFPESARRIAPGQLSPRLRLPGPRRGLDRRIRAGGEKPARTAATPCSSAFPSSAKASMSSSRPFNGSATDIPISRSRSSATARTSLPTGSSRGTIRGSNFLPGQPHEKAMELMAGCTFFVLPSRAEGVPRVLIEAMAAKKPIISTRVHGTPYLVEDGLHGLLVEPDDVEGLASKMELLLDDPELAGRLAEAGHDRVFAHFSEECYKEEFRKMMEYLVPG